jgi:hypothetical protein
MVNCYFKNTVKEKVYIVNPEVCMINKEASDPKEVVEFLTKALHS